MTPSVSRETWQRLETLASLVTAWNPSVHLVSRADGQNLHNRHIRDSLALIPYLGAATDIADIGSGAGFPGLVLAIATGRSLTLVESNAKKAAFLREAARRTEAPAKVHHGAFEDIGRPFELVTARAVAALPALLDLASPGLCMGGRCLFPKGRDHARELREAAIKWVFDVKAHPSPTSADSAILELSCIRKRAAA